MQPPPKKPTHSLSAGAGEIETIPISRRARVPPHDHYYLPRRDLPGFFLWRVDVPRVQTEIELAVPAAVSLCWLWIILVVWDEIPFCWVILAKWYETRLSGARALDVLRPEDVACGGRRPAGGPTRRGLLVTKPRWRTVWDDGWSRATGHGGFLFEEVLPRLICGRLLGSEPPPLKGGWDLGSY